MSSCGVHKPGRKRPLVDCPHPEVFFTARGAGGKTGRRSRKVGAEGTALRRGVQRKNVQKVVDFVGRRDRAVEDDIRPARRRVPREQPPRWRMPNGRRVRFEYLDTVDDAGNQQGKNISDVWVEEVAASISAPSRSIGFSGRSVR